MSDSSVHRPKYVYGMAGLALVLFLVHSVNALGDGRTSSHSAHDVSKAENAVEAVQADSDLADFREEISRIREESARFREFVEAPRTRPHTRHFIFRQ